MREPKNGEIHLYRAPLDSERGSRETLRRLVGEYLDIAPAHVRIGVHKKGKPFSLDDPSLQFSLSHSGDLCVYAFTNDRPVGIDVERFRALSDFDELVGKNFTAGERAYILQEGKDKLARFFKFWTVKEAYLKALGEGMHLRFDSLDFSIERGGFRLRSVGGLSELEEWRFPDVRFDRGYVCTLAYQGPPVDIQAFRRPPVID